MKSLVSYVMLLRIIINCSSRRKSASVFLQNVFGYELKISSQRSMFGQKSDAI